MDPKLLSTLQKLEDRIIFNFSNNLTESNWYDIVNYALNEAGIEHQELGAGCYRVAIRHKNMVIKVPQNTTGWRCSTFEVLYYNKYCPKNLLKHLPTFIWSSKKCWVTIWAFIEGERASTSPAYSEYVDKNPNWIRQFPSQFTYDWSHSNLLFANGRPICIDFGVNEGRETNMAANLEKFAETGIWEVEEDYTSNEPRSHRVGDFIQVYRGSTNAQYGRIIKVDTSNNSYGYERHIYTVQLIIDKDEFGEHDFEYLLDTNGKIKEEEVDRWDASRQNIPSYVFKNLLKKKQVA